MRHQNDQFVVLKLRLFFDPTVVKSAPFICRVNVNESQELQSVTAPTLVLRGIALDFYDELFVITNRLSGPSDQNIAFPEFLSGPGQKL